MAQTLLAAAPRRLSMPLTLLRASACSVNICYYSWAAAGLGIFFSLWLVFMQVSTPLALICLIATFLFAAPHALSAVLLPAWALCAA
jgi:hypothetical protein